MNWQPISTAPKETALLLATEFFGKGDWRIKCGSFYDGEWHVWGASWTPSHWMPLPAAPGEECRTCSGHGAVGNILTAEPCPDCTPAAAAAESFEDRISDWAHGDALDAARYRWLRDNATRSGVNIDIGAGVEISETLDAAVDDAMRLTAAKESP